MKNSNDRAGAGVNSHLLNFRLLCWLRACSKDGANCPSPSVGGSLSDEAFAPYQHNAAPGPLCPPPNTETETGWGMILPHRAQRAHPPSPGLWRTRRAKRKAFSRSEEHTSELQSL